MPKASFELAVASAVVIAEADAVASDVPAGDAIAVALAVAEALSQAANTAGKIVNPRASLTPHFKISLLVYVSFDIIFHPPQYCVLISFLKIVRLKPPE